MTDHATMKARAGELRRNQTPAERELWKRLRLRQIKGVRFLRQYVVGGCILDFSTRHQFARPSNWMAGSITNWMRGSRRRAQPLARVLRRRGVALHEPGCVAAD